VQAEQNLVLTGNFRCAPQIVGPAETLTPRMPAMRSVGAAASVAGTVEYRHVQSPIEGITDHFLPLLETQGIPLGQAAIVAPWWRHLIPVARRLREFDVPIYGPGARPYPRVITLLQRFWLMQMDVGHKALICVGHKTSTKSFAA